MSIPQSLKRVRLGVLFSVIRLTMLSPVNSPLYAEEVKPDWESLPRLRGVNYADVKRAGGVANVWRGYGRLTEEDFRVLGEEWGANVVRVGIAKLKHEKYDSLTYDEWFESELLPELDFVIRMCRKYRMYVILAMFPPEAGHILWQDPKLKTPKGYQDKIVEIWKRLASRYKDREVVIGYDLMNEPHQVPGDAWQVLANRIASAIRKMDKKTTLIVEPPHYGTPDGMTRLKPLKDKNVVYSFHFYYPAAFTHQGLYGHKPGVVYPGKINQKYGWEALTEEAYLWNKKKLEQTMQAVDEFQKQCDVPILVGEFSAVRFAPKGSAYRYIKDVVELFEKKGWHWTYHDYRGWDGWSAEHGERKYPGDIEPSSKPTRRELLLKSYFRKNKKPVFAADSTIAAPK